MFSYSDLMYLSICAKQPRHTHAIKIARSPSTMEAETASIFLRSHWHVIFFESQYNKLIYLTPANNQDSGHTHGNMIDVDDSKLLQLKFQRHAVFPVCVEERIRTEPSRRGRSNLGLQSCAVSLLLSRTSYYVSGKS